MAGARGLAARAGATVPGRVVRKFGEDQGTNQAVVIAWNMLTSFFPIVLALAAIAGFVLGHVGLASQVQIESAALSRLPVDPHDTQAALAAIRQQTGLFALVGLAGLIWSGSSLFGAMEQAFDLIFHVPTRPFLRQKVMSVSMMLLFAGLAGVVLVSTSALALLRNLPLVPAAVSQGAAVYVLQPLFGVSSGVLLFGAMYYVVPNRPQRLRETWPGALFAGAAFYVLTLAFPLYLHFAGAGMNRYGSSFGLLFVVMTFFYFVGLITMLGVELNAVLHPVALDEPERPAPSAPGKRAPAPPPGPASGPASGHPSGHPAATTFRPARRSRVRHAVFALVGAAIGTLAATRAARGRRTT